MTREEYRRAVREGLDIEWKCNQCTGATHVDTYNVQNENENIVIYDAFGSGRATPVDNDNVEKLIENANSALYDVNAICVSPIDNDSSAIYDENDIGSSPINLHTSNEEITYEKVEASSQRGEQKLIDSLGYS